MIVSAAKHYTMRPCIKKLANHFSKVHIFDIFVAKSSVKNHKKEKPSYISQYFDFYVKIQMWFFENFYENASFFAE